MEKITYLVTYLLTYLLTYLNESLLVRHCNSRFYIYNSFSLSLSLEISSWRLRALLWRKGCGGDPSPGGMIPITSIVRPTSAYFDKLSRSTGFRVSVVRFSHLNSRLNRVANTYLLTYLLDHSRLLSSTRHG